jgi:hypothetical protein
MIKNSFFPLFLWEDGNGEVQVTTRYPENNVRDFGSNATYFGEMETGKGFGNPARHWRHRGRG